MRGKAAAARAGLVAVGITPAYAGKSSSRFMVHTPLQDHPRVCGEKCDGMQEMAGLSGSPPRMRGKAHKMRESQGVLGITPAYAGKSLRCSLAFCSRWDHPRVCGEKYTSYQPDPNGPGSPPRMRGKVYTLCFACLHHRITPAYAGKSMSQPAPKA